MGSANGSVFTPDCKRFFGVRGDGPSELGDPLRLATFARAALPDAADRGAGALAFVPDEASGRASPIPTD